MSRRPFGTRRGTVEVCPISSQQPTRRGGWEERRYKEREDTSYTLDAALDFFLFSSRWTAQFLECLKLGYRSGPRLLNGAWRCFKGTNGASGGLIFGSHGPWSRVVSVFKSVLFYGFNGARPRRQLQVLAAGSG